MKLKALIVLICFWVAGLSWAMDRQPVGEAGIVSAGYDDKSRVMEVLFKSGKLVHFKGVLFSTYDKFMSAESKGEFFKENIKGRYQHKVVGVLKKKGKSGKKSKKGKKKKKQKK